MKPPSAAPSPSAAVSAGFASFFVSTGAVSVPSFGSESRAGPATRLVRPAARTDPCSRNARRWRAGPDGLGREIGVGDRRELRLSRGRDRLATRGRPTGCGRDARRRRRWRGRGRRGDGLRALQHLQRLRALEAEKGEQKDGASDRDLLLFGRFRLQWVDALRHQPVACASCCLGACRRCLRRRCGRRRGGRRDCISRGVEPVDVCVRASAVAASSGKPRSASEKPTSRPRTAARPRAARRGAPSRACAAGRGSRRARRSEPSKVTSIGTPGTPRPGAPAAA